MESETFNKAGYLKDNFLLFHLTDTNSLPISYHYHDFYKVFLLLKGDVTYHIEGKTYDLKPYDLVLVNAGEIHKPVINSTFYERMILYISVLPMQKIIILTYSVSNYLPKAVFMKHWLNWKVLLHRMTLLPVYTKTHYFFNF